MVATSIIYALNGERALDGFGTFLTPLTVICYISLEMIYQFMTSCVVVLFCSFANAFFIPLVLCSSLLIMAYSTHGISHWSVVTFIFVYPVLIFVVHCFNGCMNVSNTIRQHYLLMEIRNVCLWLSFCVTLSLSISMFLTSGEISCIMNC